MCNWVKKTYSILPYSLDNTRSCPLAKHFAVKPFLVIQILSVVEPIQVTLVQWKPWQSQLSQSVSKVKRYMRLIWVDCCRHTQCAVPSADCGAIFSAVVVVVDPSSYHTQEKGLIHYTWFAGCKMMCRVARTEIYAIHHRIHCCRIISSLHSTRLLLSPEYRVDWRCVPPIGGAFDRFWSVQWWVPTTIQACCWLP